MKDYLIEKLTDDEVRYIRGIIRNTVNTYMKNYYNVSENELLGINDNLIGENIIDNKNYDEDNFINKILDKKILRDTSALQPYSKYEQEKIVDLVDEYALNCGLEHFIAPLTFNEKLVVFLLYMQDYQVNEIAILLNIDRSSIWRRDKSIKKKIMKVKEDLKNGR